MMFFCLLFFASNYKMSEVEEDPQEYISIDPETLAIVDRFSGGEADVKNRSQKLVHLIVPEGMHPSCIVVEKEAGEFVIKPNGKVPLSESEIAMKELRRTRNGMLKACDWILSISDSPFSPEKIEEWRIYRQQLRDLPGTVDDPLNPVWPVEPSKK